MALLFSTAAAAREKLDVVRVRNGDSITCEIIELASGRLQAKTSSFGTVFFEWTDVVSIESPHAFFFEFVNGQKRTGRLRPGSQSGRIEFADATGVSDLALADIARMGQEETTLAGRIRGSASVGFEHVSATETTVLNVGFDAEYRNGPKVTELTFDLSATSTGDGDTKDSTRLNLFRQWLRQNEWFTFGLAAADRNEAQGVEARLLFGGGIGRYLFRSVDSELIAFGGVAGVEEWLAGPADGGDTRAEGIAGLRWQIFRFADIETSLSTRILVFPSLSGSGKVRARFDTSIRRELVKDLFLELGVYDSYESDPTGVGATSNDYGVSTSIGYKF